MGRDENLQSDVQVSDEKGGSSDPEMVVGYCCSVTIFQVIDMVKVAKQSLNGDTWQKRKANELMDGVEMTSMLCTHQ